MTREDTEVWFFQEENGALLWSERGHIDYVHKQLAIVLKTPPYRDLRVPHHVTVSVLLSPPPGHLARNRLVVWSLVASPTGRDEKACRMITLPHPTPWPPGRE